MRGHPGSGRNPRIGAIQAYDVRLSQVTSQADGRHMNTTLDLLELVEELQNLLIEESTGGSGAGDSYKEIRATLVANPRAAGRLPRFVKRAATSSSSGSSSSTSTAHTRSAESSCGQSS